MRRTYPELRTLCRHAEVCLTRKDFTMSRTSPFASPVPLPILSGQGPDSFAPFATERLYTVQEVASYLRVLPRTVGHFITDNTRDNKLKASFIGRRWIVSESNLRAFVDASVSE